MDPNRTIAATGGGLLVAVVLLPWPGEAVTFRLWIAATAIYAPDGAGATVAAPDVVFNGLHAGRWYPYVLLAVLACGVALLVAATTLAGRAYRRTVLVCAGVLAALELLHMAMLLPGWLGGVRAVPVQGSAAVAWLFPMLLVWLLAVHRLRLRPRTPGAHRFAWATAGCMVVVASATLLPMEAVHGRFLWWITIGLLPVGWVTTRTPGNGLTELAVWTPALMVLVLAHMQPGSAPPFAWKLTSLLPAGYWSALAAGALAWGDTRMKSERSPLRADPRPARPG